MKKMKFEEFTNAIVEKIREYLPETFANAQVELKTVLKNNDLKLTGLTITTAGSNISPTIYLEQFYEKYEDGEEMTNVLRNIADIRVKNEVNDRFDIGQITDFQRVKDHIVPHLIGREWNAKLLQQRPHTLIADLAVTYHILLGHEDDATASAAVTNQMMDAWGTTVEELHSLALSNMTTLLPSEFMSMHDVLKGIMGEEADEMMPEESPMFVLSNSKRVYGAAALLDKKNMQKIIDLVGKDFYILPSSVHEVIILQAIVQADPACLNAMICDINMSQVAADERLSNHAYRYTLEDGLCLI